MKRTALSVLLSTGLLSASIVAHADPTYCSISKPAVTPSGLDNSIQSNRNTVYALALNPANAVDAEIRSQAATPISRTGSTLYDAT